MKKTDLILIGVISFIAIVSYFTLQIVVNNSSLEGGVAVVIFEDSEVLEINLEDGSYTILDLSLGIIVDEENFLYTIPDTNGTNDLIIEYHDNRVRVIEETSPQNICQEQSWSNSPLKPISCLPNNLVILIRLPQDNELPDDITS